MLCELAELKPNETITEKFQWTAEEVGSDLGSITLDLVTGGLKISRNGTGFEVHYDLQATAAMECVRCSQPVPFHLNKSDWVSLRVEQPHQSHLVLNESEMNVRFIQDLSFDISAFVKEVIELELPAYPKHKTDDADCRLGKDPDLETSEETASPFQALSKLLEK